MQLFLRIFFLKIPLFSMKRDAFPFRLVLTTEKLMSEQELGSLSLPLPSYSVFPALQFDVMETTGGE